MAKYEKLSFSFLFDGIGLFMPCLICVVLYLMSVGLVKSLEYARDWVPEKENSLYQVAGYSI